MTPRAIAKRAAEHGLDMIAICDHNSARNTKAAVRAGRRESLVVIAGIEITSIEEVHILGLFETPSQAELVQEEVYSHLFGENSEDVFGYQVVVDEDDFVEDVDQRLLIAASTLSAEKVVKLIHEFEGLAIASHVDRGGFGIFSQLGFIPNSLSLDALEVSRFTSYSEARSRYPQCNQFPLVTSSDAHALADIGLRETIALMAEPTFAEICRALKGLEGRRIVERA